MKEDGYVSTILGNLPLKEEYEEILQHEAFTRLRYISQTGLADRVFSGLTGNRYEHSIITCGIMEIYADVLFCKNCISEDEKEILSVTALLHDIGHCPFSHLTESLIKSYESDFEHKKWGVKIINEYPDENEKTIGEILERQGYEIKEIEEIILKNNNLSIVLSHKPFGADKITYTLHDSKRAGKSVFESETFFRLVPFFYFKNNKFGMETYEEAEYFIPKIKKLFECYQNLYLYCYFSEEVRVIERMMQKVLEKEIESENIEIEKLKLQKEFEVLHNLYRSKNECSKNILKRIDACEMGKRIFSLYINEKKPLKFYKNPKNLSEKEKEIAEILKVQDDKVVILQIPELTKTIPQDFYFFENEISSFYKESPKEREFFENKADEVSYLAIYVDGNILSYSQSKLEELILTI